MTEQEIYDICSEDIAFFARNFTYLRTPEGKILFDLYIYQEVLVKELFNHHKVIINQSRQLGITSIFALYSLWLSIFQNNRNILFMAPNRDTGRYFLDIVRFMWYNLPFHLTGRKNENEKPLIDNKFEIKFKNESRIKVLSPTVDAMCGHSATTIIMDNMAFIRNCEEIFTAMIPLINNGGQIICSSVPSYDIMKGKENKFYKLWNDALKLENGFMPIKLKWDIHPDRDEEWREEWGKVLGIEKAKKELDNEFG